MLENLVKLGVGTEWVVHTTVSGSDSVFIISHVRIVLNLAVMFISVFVDIMLHQYLQGDSWLYQLKNMINILC